MSFAIGLSGMKTSTKELDVISQNVANTGTAGFKSARAELAALYSGGQPGGVEMQSVSQDFTTDGTKEFTGRSLDMAISGSGFFIVKDQAGQDRYTRAGMFSKDADNFIVNPSGMKLQGYGVNPDGSLKTGVLEDLQLGSSTIAAKASTELEFRANFKADAPVIPAAPPFDPTDSATYNFSYSSDVFDSLGNQHTVTQYMVKDAPNDWTVHYYVDGAANSTQNVTFNPDGTLNTPAAPVNIAFAPAGADPMNVGLDYTGTTQYAGEFSVSRNETDGYTSGDFAGLEVSDDGEISAVYTNGRTQLQGQVILANFTNTNGLEQANSTTWTQTFASGNPAIGAAGTGTLGSLTSGAFEGSNVDMTSELVKLMTVQRNFQANSKSVSTADQLTQILFQSM